MANQGRLSGVSFATNKHVVIYPRLLYVPDYLPWNALDKRVILLHHHNKHFRNFIYTSYTVEELILLETTKAFIR